MKSARRLEGAARAALRRSAPLLGFALFVSFFVNVLRLTGPLFMLLIYDRVLGSRSVETLVALFALLLGFLLVLGVLDYARRRMLGRMGARFQEEMEEVLFASAGRNEIYTHSKTKPTVGMDEVDGLRGFFHSSSLIAIFDFLWCPMFLFVVFLLSPVLAWVCMGGLAILAVMYAVQAVFMGDRQRTAARAGAQVGELRNLLAVSRTTLRGQDMTTGFHARWSQRRNAARDASVTLRDWVGWFEAMSRVVVMVTRYSVLAMGAYLALQGTLSVGAMVAATFMVTRVMVPVDQMLRGIPQALAARDHWTRLRSLLSRRAADMRDGYRDQRGDTGARLVLDAVSVRSPVTRAPILRSISMTLAPGDFAEVTAMSSQGKTVLAETILGMWPNAQGRILVDGRNVARIADADARSLFGYCPEQPRFVDGTLEENIARLDPALDPEKVAFAARRARLHAAIEALPDGYQTEIDADGSAFSRFERSQIALARAIYDAPRLLIIDGFDLDMLVRIPKRLDLTFAGLKERGVAVLVLTRRPLNLAATTRRFELQDGKLRELTRPARGRSDRDTRVKLVSDTDMARNTRSANDRGGAARPGQR